MIARANRSYYDAFAAAPEPRTSARAHKFGATRAELVARPTWRLPSSRPDNDVMAQRCDPCRDRRRVVRTVGSRRIPLSNHSLAVLHRPHRIDRSPSHTRSPRSNGTGLPRPGRTPLWVLSRCHMSTLRAAYEVTQGAVPSIGAEHRPLRVPQLGSTSEVPRACRGVTGGAICDLEACTPA